MLATLTDVLRCIPQSLQPNAGTVSLLGHDGFLQYPFASNYLPVILPIGSIESEVLISSRYEQNFTERFFRVGSGGLASRPLMIIKDILPYFCTISKHNIFYKYELKSFRLIFLLKK